MMRRQHPLAIASYTSKRFWLLLIPLVRGLLSIRFDEGVDKFVFNVAKWASGAEWDILVVFIMISAAVWRWFFCRYEIDDKYIKLRTGGILVRTCRIPYENICAVTVAENPVHIGLGISRVMIDTDAQDMTLRSSDTELIIGRKDRITLMNRISEVLSDGSGFDCSYKIPLWIMMVFSFFFSSAVSGVILMITAIVGASDIIGEKLEHDLLGIVYDVSDMINSIVGKIAAGISPAGITVSVIIGIGFMLSFSVNVIRHLNFRITRRGNIIYISSGIFVRRMYFINVRKINMADLRQNLLMKIAGLASVHISCSGYGKRKNEIPVFLPICATRRGTKSVFGDISILMEDILPEFFSKTDYVTPKVLYGWRFMWPPALWVVTVPFAAFFIALAFPGWHDLIKFLAVITEIPAVWMLLAKACAYCTNGFDITDDSVCARYCTWYSFHSISVPFERLAEIRISQNIFQRLNRSCDIYIYSASEHISSHIVRSMPVAEVQAIIRKRL